MGTHADVFALEYHSDIVGSEDETDLVSDLLAKLLLKIEPMGKLMRNASKLGQAEHMLLRNITNRDLTPKREGVMLADRPHMHSRDTDHLIGRDGGKSRPPFRRACNQ